jgi:hypothetical protein
MTTNVVHDGVSNTTDMQQSTDGAADATDAANSLLLLARASTHIDRVRGRKTNLVHALTPDSNPALYALTDSE